MSFSSDNHGARVGLFLSMLLNTGPHRIPIIGITPMNLLKGMSKKRPTRAPYEIHNLEGMI